MKLEQTLDMMAGKKLQGRMVFQGMNISIEHKKGSVRSGTSPQGKKWSTTMKHHYGYIRLSKGADGEHVDCYVGQHPDATHAHIVHQNNPETGKYDEDKVMLGFKTPADAKKGYRAHYDSDKFFGSMTSISMEKFKKRIQQRTGKRLAASLMSTPAEGITGLEMIKVFVKTGRSKMPEPKRDMKEMKEEQSKRLDKMPRPFPVRTADVAAPQGDAQPIGTRVPAQLYGGKHG